MTMSSNLEDLVSDPSLYEFKYVDDSLYPVLIKTNQIKDWDAIFQIEEPIQYKDQKIPTDNIVKVDVSNIWPDIEYVEQIEFKNSGYSIPYFHFLNQRLFPDVELVDDFETFMKEIDTTKQKVSLIHEIGSAKRIIHDQLGRELNHITEINEEITNIIKVIFLESQHENDGDRIEHIEDELNLFPELRFFVRDMIYGGALLDTIIPDWIPGIINENNYISNELKYATVKAIKKLLNEREPYLNTSENLARQILTLESILKDKLIGRETKFNEYILSQYPNPAKLANKFKEEAPNPTHSVNDIRNVMVITRDIIIKEKLKTLNREVNRIAKECLEEHGLDIHVDVVRNWVNYYGEAALPLYKKQRQNK